MVYNCENTVCIALIPTQVLRTSYVNLPPKLEGPCTYDVVRTKGEGGVSPKADDSTDRLRDRGSEKVRV